MTSRYQKLLERLLLYDGVFHKCEVPPAFLCVTDVGSCVAGFRASWISREHMTS
jgi:hypothetical protein